MPQVWLAAKIAAGLGSLFLGWKVMDELNDTAKIVVVGGVVYLGGKVMKVW